MLTVLQQSVLCTHTQYTPYAFYQLVCYTVLVEAMCAAIFPHKTTTTVCLGFCFHTSSMAALLPVVVGYQDSVTSSYQRSSYIARYIARQLLWQ